MPDVARETRDLPPKRLMGYYDSCQTPLFLATNGKRPVHLTYDFSLRQYSPETSSYLLVVSMIDQMRCHSFCLFPRHIHGLALAISFRRTFFSMSSPGDLRSLFRLPPARCPLQTRQKKPAFRYYICCNFLDLVLCKISQFVVWFIYVTCTYFFVSIVV